MLKTLLRLLVWRLQLKGKYDQLFAVCLRFSNGLDDIAGFFERCVVWQSNVRRWSGGNVHQASAAVTGFERLEHRMAARLR